jgi:hypothetical protein
VCCLFIINNRTAAILFSGCSDLLALVRIEVLLTVARENPVFWGVLCSCDLTNVSGYCAASSTLKVEHLVPLKSWWGTVIFLITHKNYGIL